MSWSQFTKNNLKLIKSYIEPLATSRVLLKSIKNERYKIKQFIKTHGTLDIHMAKLTYDEILVLDKTINKLSNVKWVDFNNLQKDLPNLTNNYKITWKTNNIIYIKTSGQLEQKIKRFELLIWMMEYLKEKTLNTNKHITMYLILSNLEKKFPDLNEMVGVSNANTGYTDFKMIYIWRLEEFEKVLFHEVVHYLKMDNSREHVNKIAEIDGPTSYYEAITDVWGIYYHLIYLSLITRVSIKKLLEIELAFIKNQAMSMNNFMGLGNWVDYPKKTIQQTTPAFSYYILKYLLFNYLLDNEHSSAISYNNLLTKSLSNGFKIKPYIKIKSSRMSLLQLE